MVDAVLEISKKNQILLIYGYLREIVSDYTINIIFNIIKKYIIIQFCWNKNTLLNCITLSNNNLIVTNNNELYGHPMILCNIVFRSDKHSFIVKLVNISSFMNVSIGVVQSNYKASTIGMLGGKGKGWGFALDGTIKAHYKGEWKLYGKECKNGDIIKCQIDYDNKTIEYYINNKSQGIAFKDLNGDVRPAVNLFRKGDCIQLLNVK